MDDHTLFHQSRCMAEQLGLAETPAMADLRQQAENLMAHRSPQAADRITALRHQRLQLIEEAISADLSDTYQHGRLVLAGQLLDLSLAADIEAALDDIWDVINEGDFGDGDQTFDLVRPLFD